MNKTKKQEKDKEPTKQEKCQIELLKQLYENIPHSIIDRIHVLTHVLQTQFQIFSFEYASGARSHDEGKIQIDAIHEELQKYIDSLQLDLMKMWQEGWEEDKEFRKVKG